MIDLGLLENYSLEHSSEANFCKWTFDHPRLTDFPLAFFSRPTKPVRYCNLSVIASTKEDEQYQTIKAATKVVSKDYAVKSVRMGDKRKMAVASTRIYTKKQQRNYRPWFNQYRTKLKEITVKNDWTLLRSIDKKHIEDAKRNIVPKVTVLREEGRLFELNQRVEKIKWNAGIQVKENAVYDLKPVSTIDDKDLVEKSEELFDQQNSKRRSVVGSIDFITAILTVRSGQYPWAITLEKSGNIAFINRYSPPDAKEQLSYLDLFSVHENTSQNMPTDEKTLREHCELATRRTRMFKDLITNGELHKEFVPEKSEEADEGEEEEGAPGEGKAEAEQRDDLKRTVKIELDNYDIYTSVTVDGVRRRGDNEPEECLVRSFVETGSDRVWEQLVKHSHGDLVVQESDANACSIQKWLCEAYIAGVNVLKFGYVGSTDRKPTILSVEEVAPRALSANIDFRAEEPWFVLKFFLDMMFESEDGTYILYRAPYAPLNIKLYSVPEKDESDDEEDDGALDNRK